MTIRTLRQSMNFTVVHEETLGWRLASTGGDKKYHWIGKLNASGSALNGATDFPWGNDETENNILVRKTPTDARNPFITVESKNLTGLPSQPPVGTIE